MFGFKKNNRMQRALMEACDSRLLLSAASTPTYLVTTVDGQNGIYVNITGTPGNDNVVVSANDTDKNGVSAVVTFGKGKTAATRIFTHLLGFNMDTGRGKDSILLTSTTDMSGHYTPFNISGQAWVNFKAVNFNGSIFASGGDHASIVDMSLALGSNVLTNPSNSYRTLIGGAGNALLIGSNDRDYLIGGEGNDTLLGNNGDDQLMGGGGENLINGGRGDDVITMQSIGMTSPTTKFFSTYDTIYGGKGNNMIVRYYDSGIDPAPVWGYQSRDVQTDFIVDNFGSGKG